MCTQADEDAELAAAIAASMQDSHPAPAALQGRPAALGQTAAGKGPAPTSIQLPDGSCVVRRVIPSDNSCLFNAVGYVMEHDRHKAAALRQVIADTVSGDPGGGLARIAVAFGLYYYHSPSTVPDDSCLVC